MLLAGNDAVGLSDPRFDFISVKSLDGYIGFGEKSGVVAIPLVNPTAVVQATAASSKGTPVALRNEYLDGRMSR